MKSINNFADISQIEKNIFEGEKWTYQRKK